MKATFSKILSILFLALYVLTFTSCDKSELVSPQDTPILKAFDGGDDDDCDDGNANEGDITDDEDDDEDGKDITDDEDDDEDDNNKSFLTNAKPRK